MKYPSLALAAVALLAAAPTPPPPPPPLNATTPAPTASIAPVTSPSPAPSASPDAAATPVTLDNLFGPAPGAKAPPPPTNAKGQPAAPVDARKGIDGVWEIQIQRGANTEYEHFFIKQTGTDLAGTYLTQDKKKYPVAGALDGRNIRIVVSLPDGSTMLFEGRVDGTTDMIGMLTDSKERVPFTAAYRPKEK